MNKKYVRKSFEYLPHMYVSISWWKQQTHIFHTNQKPPLSYHHFLPTSTSSFRCFLHTSTSKKKGTEKNETKKNETIFPRFEKDFSLTVIFAISPRWEWNTQKEMFFLAWDFGLDELEVEMGLILEWFSQSSESFDFKEWRI